MPAHMIPNKPKEFDSRSREGDIFRALEKLSEDYYVFHSFRSTVVNDENTIYDREIDFVIANRKKGILCLEAKAGAGINYYDRAWRYSNGSIMHRGGPYKQIYTAKRTLIDKIKNHHNAEVRLLADKCKFFHGVFFVDVCESDFLSWRGIPEEADSKITLFAEDIINPSRKINNIFSINLPNQVHNVSAEPLSEDEFKLLLDAVLCPHFNIVPSPKLTNIVAEVKMNQLLREQYRILDFLEEQDSAVINGAAGTGKTMLAVEKARRHSVAGEKVLFLCYNRMLRDHLHLTNKKSEDNVYKKQFQNVDFMTISQLTHKVTGNYMDFNGLNQWLSECLGDVEKFSYKHIIVDEGQDFGLVDAEGDRFSATNNCSIIDALQMVAQENGGTFYLFYDKYQTIQGRDDNEYELPDCINNSDCRLTLRQNCRNTNEIARTSVVPLRDHKNKAIKCSTAFSWDEPIKPVLHIIDDYKDTERILQDVLKKYSEAGVVETVILTQGMSDFSSLANLISYDENSGYYEYCYDGKSYKVTTCKKFKGLEADAIVVVDLDKDSFSGKKGMQFYVGSSRAKYRLDIVCKLTQDEYCDVVKTVAPNAPKTNNIERLERILSNAFGVEIKQLNPV